MSLDHLKKQPKTAPDGRIPPQGGSSTAPPAAPEAAPSPPAPPKATGFVPLIKFSCGHEFAGPKLAGRPCQECCYRAAAQARKERSDRKRLKYETKQANRSIPDATGRLPNFAQVVMTYDAVSVQWTGTLEIPGYTSLFCATASSQKKLLAALDAQYRAAVAAKEQGNDE